MNRFKLISFLLLFSLGTIITLFNSCGKDEIPVDKNDQPGTDPDKPDFYAVTGISLLGDNTLSLAVDGSYTFKTTVYPEYATDQTITWTSSDPARVDVSDNGKITALSVGMAIITAKVGDKTDTCRVTVTRAATKITLNYTTLDLIVGGEDGLLEVTLEPSDATDVIVWECKTEDLKDVSKAVSVNGEGNLFRVGKLTAIDNGTAIVIAKAGTRTQTCKVTVKYDPTIDKGVTIKGINGIKWATRNVDKPGQFAAPGTKGMFYQWNRDIGWSTSGSMVASDGSSWDNTYSTDGIWTISNNVCPNGWRIPTVGEWKSFLKSDNRWEKGDSENNKSDGRLFGSGENTVFLPAAGYRDGDDGALLKGGDTDGYYWTDSGRYNDNEAFNIHFNNAAKADTTISIQRKKNGFSVRCVKDE